MPSVTLGRIVRTNGVAGQYSYTVTATYPGGERIPTTFIGNLYSEVVFLSLGGFDSRVVNAERFGDKLNPSWVRKFFGVSA